MDLTLEALKSLFERDLERLKKEIEAYTNAKNLWLVESNINNSSGNLCLHLCGNLQYFIGAVLGNSGYQRDRDLEFNTKDVPLKELLELIEQTELVVKQTLSKVNTDDLQKVFPVQVFGYDMTTVFFLIHLSTHLNYHLGQINYHRRLIDLSS